jgi:hypothetical protein
MNNKKYVEVFIFHNLFPEETLLDMQYPVGIKRMLIKGEDLLEE